MRLALILGAIKGPYAFAGIPGKVPENIETAEQWEEFVFNESPIPLKKKTVDMGINFEDVYGFSHLLCYCGHKHPHPMEVAEYNTIYLRDLRTQGSIWMTGMDRDGTPKFLDYGELIIMLAQWFNDRQTFWMHKFHRGPTDQFDSADREAAINTNLDFNGLIMKLRNAP